MFVGKQFDPIMGMDIHIIQPPGPVPPVPIPHPFIGMVFDPVEFVPIIGATVFCNGLPRAHAGSAVIDVPPHIPIGGMFVKPPMNEGEIYMGSKTVIAEGEPLTYMGARTLTCQDVGMPSLPRPNRKSKTKIKSLMLPTSTILPIPKGGPILVFGALIIRALVIQGVKILGKMAVKRAAKAAAKKAVENNFKRFVKKIPANSKSNVTSQALKNGTHKFSATSPGKVPGSKAVYEKIVSAEGNTISMTKTTYAPNGSIIHIKPK